MADDRPSATADPDRDDPVAVCDRLERIEGPANMGSLFNEWVAAEIDLAIGGQIVIECLVPPREEGWWPPDDEIG